MNKDFELFKKTFTAYQKKFGLMGYKVYFKHESLEGAYAKINVYEDAHTVTVRLESNPTKDDGEFWDVKTFAKHEALHLLLARLTEAAVTRYTSEENIIQAGEEIVYKLEGLLDGKSP